ncbi:MAG: 4Fe-4S binding protein [Fibrobacter sp.]|nr:4Fe-4S binding protein [Fibrobacter sp.]
MIIVRKELCPQSHRCPTMAICPVGAISQNGFSAPVVDNEKCIKCGKCTKRCPVFSKEPE